MNPVSEDKRFPPEGEVHGKDRKFWKNRNADAVSCRLVQGYPSLPEEPFAYAHLSVHMYAPLHVYIGVCVCMQFFVHIVCNITLTRRIAVL